MSATLKLARQAAGIELVRRPFEILKDGKTVGSLAIHETAELQVPAGRYKLRLRAGRRLSPERSFEATDGEVINFSCHGARIWPIYVASLIKPDLGISLKQK